MALVETVRGPVDTGALGTTLMHEHDVTHIPVVENDKVVGIVARGDIVRFLAATT